MKSPIAKIFTKFPEIYSPSPEDIGLLCKLDRSNIIELLKYSLGTIDRIHNSISKCNNMAVSSITIFISLSGAFYLLIKENISDSNAIKIIYILNLILVLISVLLSLWSLFVRFYKTPSPIGNAIEWIKHEEEKTLNERMIPTLIQSISIAEINHLEVLEKKSNLLKIGQIIGFLSITCIFISMMVINLFY